MSEEVNKMSKAENNEMDTNTVVVPPTVSTVLKYCVAMDWDAVVASLSTLRKGMVSAEVKASNGIATTILHQAISGKGDKQKRAEVVHKILDLEPEAAAKKNGFQSYPLHALLQRNNSLDKASRDEIMHRLIDIHEEAMSIAGGPSKRFPLHILLTDALSVKADLIKHFIEKAPEVVSKKDKNGWFPAHVACYRHCSPAKLEMLLELCPEALTAESTEGDKATLFSLACTHATEDRNNHDLKQALKRKLQQGGHWTSEMEKLERIPPKKTNSNRKRKTEQKFSSPQVVDGPAKKRKRKTASPRAKRAGPAARDVVRLSPHSTGSKRTISPSSRPPTERPIDSVADEYEGEHAFVHFVRTIATRDPPSVVSV